MKSLSPKLVILAVYQKKNTKEWKGFCYPYDVTCYAETQEKAIKKLEKLVKFYEEGLQEYHYPEHLTFKSLSDKEDLRVLNLIKKIVAQKIKERIEGNILEYQKIEKSSFHLKNSVPATGYYYQPQPCFCNT
ncbi:MAG: hypothetical protein V1690_03735 [Candidatus Moraniibacteriota bacterium]